MIELCIRGVGRFGSVHATFLICDITVIAFATAAGESQAIFKEYPVAVVNPVGREISRIVVEVSKLCYIGMVSANIEVVGSEEVVSV